MSGQTTTPDIKTPKTDTPEKTGTPKKKVFVKTFGCQMNVYDTERMKDLIKGDYSETDEPDDADLVILNTCHIREKAAEKVYSDLGRLKANKTKRQAEGKATTIAVTGCVAQAEGKEILRRAPVVDLVVGPQSYQNLPKLLDQSQKGERVAAEFDVVDKFKALKGNRTITGPSAFVTVQEGCDKFCAFCVVPYTRGAEVSRPVEAIVEEVRALVQHGVREVNLLGQNVNAFHGQGLDGDSWTLARLIRHLAKIDRLDRLRFTTSHPRDMDDDLIAAHGDTPKLMPYLHLPIQSGSDAILKAMNRKHTAAEYRQMIDDLRQARPDIALSSDFIVGFPGESDQDFEDTMQLVRDVTFAMAYSFKYSERPGTPAAEKHDQVPEAVKSERLQRLQALLREQTLAFNHEQIGKTLPVLFEKPGRKLGQMQGRSPYLQSVYVDGPEDLKGEIVEVEITGATLNSLQGHLVR